jgi:hypothetical protein
MIASIGAKEFPVKHKFLKLRSFSRKRVISANRGGPIDLRFALFAQFGG